MKQFWNTKAYGHAVVDFVFGKLKKTDGMLVDQRNIILGILPSRL
jgi:hypothetical protein